MAVEEHVDPENPPKNLKRKHENSILDNFTKLTHSQEKIRVKAATDLLKYLTETANEVKDNNELKYALGRLVRGLGSSKTLTKTGFFAALVALFDVSDVSLGQVFEVVEKELHKGGGNSKSENADVCSGQVLVAGAVLRSDLYKRGSEGDKVKVLELLLNAGKERTYLTLASYKFLVDLFEKIDSAEFEKLIFPLIKAELSKQWQIQNLDSLYLMMEVQRIFPQSLHSKFLKNNLGTSEVLALETLPQICNTLTTIPRIMALKHPIFDIIIASISKSDLLVHFFGALDQTLTKTNRNKHFVVTKLLSGVLERLDDPTTVPDLLAKNYIQQTLNTYKTSVGKQRDRDFEEASKNLFEALVAVLKKDGVKSKTKIKVLKKLLFYPGTFIFEKVTRSKLVQNITATLNTEGVKKLGAVYRDVVLATNEKVVNEHVTEKWWNIDRVYASHLLVKLVNHPAMQDIDWKVEQLVFLGRLALLDKDVGHELADSLKETFYSALDLKLSKLDDLRQVLSRVFGAFSEDDVHGLLSGDVYDVWKRTADVVGKLEGKSKKKSAVFHTLFLNLGLQVFNNAKLATESLTELFSCYERTKVKGEASGDDPLWIEVVTDLFLNLLSHNSHLLRSVINCVFPHLCKYMNATAIHQVLGVLDPKNETPLSKLGEEEEGSEDEEESEEEEEEEEEEEDEEDDDETVNEKLRMALHQALGADADAESVDLDDLDEEEGEKLDEALGKAFKQFRPNLGRAKKQKKDDEALTHFRIRVLDLVEIYLNSNPSMILCLEIMLPLLQTLEFCVKDDHQKPLQDRVKACLKKLSSLKKFSDTEEVTEKVLVDLLRSLLEKGTKNMIVVQEMGEKMAECCIFLISCSQILQSGGKKVAKAVTKGLEEFFTRRDCVIPYVLFKNLVQTNWVGVLDLVPFLGGFVFAETVRPFRRSQAAELLNFFYHNQRLFSSHEDAIKELEETTVNFLKDCIDFFREFAANPSEKKVKEKFLCHVFELLTSIKASALGRSFGSWEAIGEGVRECRSQLTFARDTKLAFNKLCKGLNVSHIVQMKPKVLKLSNVEEPLEKKEKDKNKKKKKKGDKNRLKLKKETKHMRLESLSEGLNKRKFQWEEEGEKKARVE